MMYTKEKIAIELKIKINKLDYDDISKWALDVYLTDVAANDASLDAILSRLIMINEGPEFELSHKELSEIADVLSTDNKYTRYKFGKELKEKVHQKLDIENIGNWAYAMYLERTFENDNNFHNLLIYLGAMSSDPQFELSYQELDQIADQLITGQDVCLYTKNNHNVQQPTNPIVKKPYTRIDFATELKNKIQRKEDLADITDWFYTTYSQYYHFIYLPHRHNKRDKKFRELLMKLYVINRNTKFKYSYEQLNNIADQLIAGKNVKLE